MAAEGVGRVLEELSLSAEEVSRLGRAFRDEEFKRLFREYAEELSDPEKQRLREQELGELERRRGVEVTFVHPAPGYVIKSSEGGRRKAFVNVCKSDKVGPPHCRPRAAAGDHGAAKGLDWSIPYLQAPPRRDFDRKRNECVVYDVVFHPDTYTLAQRNIRMKKLVEDTALDAVETNFEVKLDRNNLCYPKMKYKGVPQSTVIRKKIEGFVSETQEEDDFMQKVYPSYPAAKTSVKEASQQEPPAVKKASEEKKKENPEDPYTVPHYVLKHRRNFDIQDFRNTVDAKLYASRPSDLVLEVELPLLSSTKGVDLEVDTRKVSLTSHKPAKYKLDLDLPYPVDGEKGSAQFDQSKRKLVLTLPVLPPVLERIPVAGATEEEMEADSGIESAQSSPFDEVPVCPLLQETLASNPVCEVEAEIDCLTYLLPPYTINASEETLAFVLKVSNVVPDSVKKEILEECGTFRIQLTSLGSGLVPFHYALNAQIPPRLLTKTSLLEEDLEVEVCGGEMEGGGGCVVMRMPWRGHVGMCNEVYVGLHLERMERKEVPCPVSIATTLASVKEEAEDSEVETSRLQCKVLEKSKEKLVVELVEPVTKEEENTGNESSKAGRGQKKHHTSGESEESPDRSTRQRRKCRSLSDSSDDQVSKSEMRRPKGILKRRTASIQRSLSESSMDDTCFLPPSPSPSLSSSPSPSLASCSKACHIPEDIGEEERKSVRFNDVVRKQLYRSDSSILGQRKKNQKKARSKRRARARRASESEPSEGESEPTGNEKESENSRERELHQEKVAKNPDSGNEEDEEEEEEQSTDTKEGLGLFSNSLLFDLDLEC